jgi:hypothetical protein
VEKIMKKLMTALAICAVTGFAAAQVTSVNVVGYNNVTLVQGYNMLALNFDNVTNTTGGLDLNTLIPGTTANLTAGGSGAADQVQVYSGGNYSTYFLYYSTKTATSYNYQWVVSAGVPCTNKFKSGDAFWYNKRGATAVTIPFAGQAPNDASKSRAIVAGYNMIGSMYSADWDPNAYGASYWATNGAVHGGSGAADQIMLYSGGNYATYFLYYSTKTATSYNNTWVVSAGVAAPANFIKLGSGVWYNHRGTGFTLPQTIPYSL